MIELIPLAIGAGMGVAGQIGVDGLKERLRFRRELKANNQINISGEDWIAAWQTSVDCRECLNSERLTITQKGSVVKMFNHEKSPENPIGGYKWEGRLEFFHGRELMGIYSAVEDEQNNSKGTLFLTYNSASKEFLGRWVGVSYDGPLSSGFCVISKTKQKAMRRLKAIIDKHPDKVPILAQLV